MMINDEDAALFHEQTKGIKRIKQDTFWQQRNGLKKKAEIKEIREREDALFFFSDEYEPLLNEDQSAVKYLRENEDSYLLKQLRRGDFPPELFLDLHGLTREQAKTELAALIQACRKEQVFCAAIMTGYGTYTLKRQIPRWLVQHPNVRALHQAPHKWGGAAAILILVDVQT